MRDNGLKYAAVISTQRPSIFAMIQAERFDRVNDNPYEIARQFIIGYNENPRQTPTNASTAQRHQLTATPPVATNENIDSAILPQTVRSTVQSENSLAAQIDELKLAIREIRMEMTTMCQRIHRNSASIERPTRTTTNANSNSANADPTLCWYHQTYGLRAFLCRNPCRLRRQEAVAAP